MTTHYHTESELQKDQTLFKFFWVKTGYITIEVDHVLMRLEADEIIAVTPLHLIDIRDVEGEYLTLLFNGNFYCIYGHDKEVSCSGFLFHGSSDVLKLTLQEPQHDRLVAIEQMLHHAFETCDSLQEETLRCLLKIFIIGCTRIAREKYKITGDSEKSFDLIRRFYVLVDQHYKEKKQVQEYAELLHRSPKTLSHIFQTYRLATPLRIIHERIEAEARRLLIHTSKSAKEIGDILGFEDQATFSRFFKKMTGESIFEYRKREKHTSD